MTWTLHYTRQAQKNAKKLASSGLKAKAQALLAILEKDHWQIPPPFEKFVSDLSGAYSRRINIQHRRVYQVMEAEKAVKILWLWTHYKKKCMTQLYQSKIFTNGSTSLPKPARDALGVKTGDSLRYVISGDGVEVFKIPSEKVHADDSALPDALEADEQVIMDENHKLLRKLK